MLPRACPVDFPILQTSVTHSVESHRYQRSLNISTVINSSYVIMKLVMNQLDNALITKLSVCLYRLYFVAATS